MSFYDLEKSLSSLSAFSGKDLSLDLELLIQKYDKKEDRRITYIEFIDELTPK